MGTRGTWGFVKNGEVKLTYNHWDSYPSGLGDDVLKFARGLTDEQRAAVAALRMVEDSVGRATDEDVERLQGFADPGVGSRDLHDWYVLLRGTQGNPAATLEAGVMIDGSHFPANSLFCEWGYVIDLDANVFEVYRGFQEAEHSDGRFAGMEHIKTAAGEYWPIRLIASYPLSELPDALDEAVLDPSDDED